MPPEQPAQVTTAQQRILIVDDNQDAADSLALLLQLDGHETQAVYGSKAALERAQSYQPGRGAAGYRPAGDEWL